METLLRDLRFGLRMLAKNAGFAAVVIVVLALGIGANTIIFSVVNAVLLRPLPFPNPGRLVQIWEVNLSDSSEGTISPFNFVDWTAQSQSFERMAVYAFSNFTLLDAQGPIRMSGVKASGDFFLVFGVKPMLGRPLGKEDDKPGSRAAVLSHRAWQRRFAGDPSVIGRKVILNGEPYTVIGVMPPGFQFPNRNTDIWTSPAFELEGLDRGNHFLFGVGRLKPGVTLAMAQSEAAGIADRLARLYPASNEGSGILFVPLQEQMFGSARRQLLMLWSAVTLVLLIACANVANLLLARAVSRQKDVLVRLAVGASRARIIRQFLAESALLVLAGGAAGLTLAVWGTRYLASGGASGIPRSQEINIDGWVLGFSAVLSLLTALIFGIAPALHASRGRLHTLLNQSGSHAPRGGLSQRLPKLVVAFEVGIAVVLLTTAGLLLKSLYLLRQVDVGFEFKGLVTMQLSLPPSLYPDSVERAALFQQVMERIDALPGTEGVGGVNDLPFSGSRTQSSFDIIGIPPESAADSRTADYRTVAGDYFRIMGIGLLRGRAFELGDGSDAPRVAIINDALARRYFRGADPLGRSLMIQGSTARVVGIVDNLKHESLAAENVPEIYVPFGQGSAPEWIYLTVRTGLSLESLVPSLRSAAREVLPDHPVYNIQSMEDRLALSIAPQRFNSLVLSIFASLAMILSAVGIYAVVAYATKQRTREIAVRMALGARRADVIRLVVVDGFVPATVGIVLGLAGSLAVARLLRAMLFGISPTDPAIFVLMPVVLAAVAVLAGYVPAKRATAVNPIVAIRNE